MCYNMHSPLMVLVEVYVRMFICVCWVGVDVGTGGKSGAVEDGASRS